MLYYLSLCINPDASSISTRKFAFLAAFLHIISPAGLFLSTPYAESPFSFFNFAGFFLYTKSSQIRLEGKDGTSNILLATSGITFGLASTFRSNGLLSGLIFCYEVINAALTLSRPHNFSANLRRLSAVLLAGSLMAIGTIIPQYLAYREYCVDVEATGERRPWCSKWVPSIYAWVQQIYW